MNGHDRIRYLLSSALEFQLSTPESQMVDEHLARCSACRAFGTALRSDMTAARAWPMPAPSARLEAAVVAMAVSPARVRVGAPTRTVAFAWAAVLALLFAALIGLAIAGAPQLERLLANIVPAP